MIYETLIALRSVPLIALSLQLQPVLSQPLGPTVDHHQHVLGPKTAELLEKVDGILPAAPVILPPHLRDVLDRRTAAWSDAQALARIYSADALMLEDRPTSGRTAVSEFVVRRFRSPYAIVPLAYDESENNGRLAAIYTRGEGVNRTNLGLSLITFQREGDGVWRITSETMKFPAPPPYQIVTAEALINKLDEADIQRAVVMSVAYFFESPLMPRVENAAAKLRAENDWTAAQVRKYRDRLIGFCGINPLTDYAVPELRRCKEQLGMRGLKLHFGNSGVDLATPDHLHRLKKVFAAANEMRMPVAAHLWTTSKSYGRKDAEIFLSELLPVAPDVVVQIMHMAGAGPGWTDEALEVFATAVRSRDPRTRNLYFDVATVADLQSPKQLDLLAQRIRQIGPERILYGSDAFFGGRNTPDEEWGTFRGMVPLTDAEFAIIRDNVAPYLK